MAGLRFAEEHATEFLISAVLQGLAVSLMVWPLYYLFRAARHRSEEIPRFLRMLVLAGPIAFGILFAARQGALNSAAADLVPRLEGLPKDRAEDLIDEDLSTTGLGVLAGLAFAAQLAAAAAVVLVSNHARRVGLLSNFIGIIGILVGVFVVIPIFGMLPIVQLFWLGALAVLFSGRWPGGRPLAWQTGEAEPWPTAQEVRAQRDAARLERDEQERGRSGSSDEPDEEYEELSGADLNGEPAGPAHPRSKKRKRKRKR